MHGETNICAGFAKENIMVRFNEAVIQPTVTDVRIFDINTGAKDDDYVAADPPVPTTAKIGLKFYGGYFDSGSESSTPRATVFTGRRVRRVLFDGQRLRGIVRGWDIPALDTITITNYFCRRVQTCIEIPHWSTATGATPQDYNIHTGSFTSNIAATFLTIGSVVDSLHVHDMGFACRHAECQFIEMVTGTTAGCSGNIRVDHVATEQATGATLFRIHDTGLDGGAAAGCAVTNVAVHQNSFGSAGATVLDFSRVGGTVTIVANEFPGRSQTAIKMTNVRPDAAVRVSDNTFRQLTAGGTYRGATGTLWDMDVPSTHAKVIFGRNILPYQEALDAGTTIGTITFTPVDHHFIFTDLGLSTATVASAATITLSPWDSVVKISGANTISKITPTWAGHRVTFICTNTAVFDASDDGSENLFIQHDFTCAEHSTITLVGDGTNWYRDGKAPISN